MKAILISLVESIFANPANYGIFLLCCIVLTAIVTIKIKGFLNKCKNSNKKFGNIDKSFVNVNEKMDSFGGKLDAIGASLMNLCTALHEKKVVVKNYTPQALIQSSSPINLTENGIKFVEKSGAKTAYLSMKQELTDKVLSNAPYKNYLDFEQACLRAIDNTQREELNEPKNYIYENPVTNGIAVTIYDIVKMIGIMLRNDILKEHKDIVTSSLKKK